MLGSWCLLVDTAVVFSVVTTVHVDVQLVFFFDMRCSFFREFHSNFLFYLEFVCVVLDEVLFINEGREVLELIVKSVFNYVVEFGALILLLLHIVRSLDLLLLDLHLNHSIKRLILKL